MDEPELFRAVADVVLPSVGRAPGFIGEEVCPCLPAGVFLLKSDFKDACNL